MSAANQHTGPQELCQRGLHPLSGYNLRLDRGPDGQVIRRCRECTLAAFRQRAILTGPRRR